MPTYRGIEVTGFAQDDTGVDVELSDGRSLRAQYLVGCDGGRSLVRKAAGIAFPGSNPTTSNLIAEAELAETPPEWGIRRDALNGTHVFGRGRVRDPQRQDSLRGSRAGRCPRDRTARWTDHRNPPSAISARRSSPSTGPITGSTLPLGFPGSPTCCAAGGLLPQGTRRADSGRRRACASPRRRPGVSRLACRMR